MLADRISSLWPPVKAISVSWLWSRQRISTEFGQCKKNFILLFFKYWITDKIQVTQERESPPPSNRCSRCDWHLRPKLWVRGRRIQNHRLWWGSWRIHWDMISGHWVVIWADGFIWSSYSWDLGVRFCIPSMECEGEFFWVIDGWWLANRRGLASEFVLTIVEVLLQQFILVWVISRDLYK